MYYLCKPLNPPLLLLCHLANVVLRGVKAQGSDKEPQKIKAPHRQRCETSISLNSCFKSLFNLSSEFSTSFEFNHLSCGDSDFLLCGRIYARALTFLNYSKSTETNQGNLVALSKGATNSAQSSLEGSLSLNFS